MNTTQIALLRLRAIPDLGIAQAKKLIEIFGSPEAIFEQPLSELKKVTGKAGIYCQHFLDEQKKEMAIAEYWRNIKKGIEIVDFTQANYPTLLKECNDAPLLFFKEGNINASYPKSISIVGTRKMTSYGKRICEEIIETIAPYKPLIVSGFAYGVDITAHKAALHHQLPTIGIFAHGFGTLYPNNHKAYYQPVLKDGGFVSEHCFDERPLPPNFLRRNRIVAGLTQATLVVESAYKGGALYTAGLANSYNREVFAIPGAIGTRQSEGCNNLIKRNIAMLITSGKDIIEALDWDRGKPQKKKSNKIKETPAPSLFNQINEEEASVIKLLETKDKLHIDQMAQHLKKSVHELMNLLFQLEMKGLIKPLSGNHYQKIP